MNELNAEVIRNQLTTGPGLQTGQKLHFGVFRNVLFN